MMFHFNLVHILGSFHGPDRLSHRRSQPGDLEEIDDAYFDNWVDQVNGFLHMTSTMTSRRIEQLPIMIYIKQVAERTSDTPDQEGQRIEGEGNGDENPYEVVPRIKAAHKADRQVEKVREWHETLEQPEGFLESEYTVFLRYCIEFFIASKILWKKDQEVGSFAFEAFIHSSRGT
jgi:hypothetical protein